jgi:hypothetical protein
MASYITVTAHYINDDKVKIISRVLATIMVEGSHTAENLAEIIKGMLKVYPNKTPLQVNKILIMDIKTKIAETLSDKLVNIENVGDKKYSINKSVNEFMLGTFSHKYLIGNNKSK